MILKFVLNDSFLLLSFQLMLPLIDHSRDLCHSVLPFLWSPFGFNTFVHDFCPFVRPASLIVICNPTYFEHNLIDFMFFFSPLVTILFYHFRDPVYIKHA